jgi:hypothetical protein
MNSDKIRLPGVFMKAQCLLGSQKGSALIICLLSLAVLSALGTAALMVSTTNQTIAGNYRKQSQAFFVAEAGLQKAIAELKNDMAWRGETTIDVEINGVVVVVPASEGNMVIGNITAGYTVKIFDTGKDATLPGGHIRLISEGAFQDSRQTVESIVRFSPDPDFKANSPPSALVSSGKNHAKGTHVINGYNNDGVKDSDSMVLTEQYLPDVNQDALKTFADIIIEGDLTDNPGPTDFWKDPFNDPPERPYIIHVTGDLNLSGNVQVYGVIFVEGEVSITGSARVVGVVYAPNATQTIEIKGAGSPDDQPVVGQLISGTGGVQPAGNHGDVQYVKAYVDAFNNFGGEKLNIDEAPGSWRQY